MVHFFYWERKSCGFIRKKISNHKGNWYSVVNRNWSYAIQTYSQYCPHPKTTWHLVHKNTKHIKHPKVFSNKRRVESAKCSFTWDSVWWFLLILSFKFANNFWASNIRLKLKGEVDDTQKWQSNPSEQSTIFMENPWPFTIWESITSVFVCVLSLALSFILIVLTWTPHVCHVLYCAEMTVFFQQNLWLKEQSFLSSTSLPGLSTDHFNDDGFTKAPQIRKENLLGFFST